MRRLLDRIMYGPNNAYQPEHPFGGLLSKSVADALEAGTPKPEVPVVKKFKPDYHWRVNGYRFEVTKDDAGVWLKASIECEPDMWIHEYLYSDGTTTHFKLYSRKGDHNVSTLAYARRNQIFPIGTTVRLA